jgi:hypothetical protein
MPRDLITETGRALYGARWYSEMAGELGVSQRTVRRWAAGEFEAPPGVYRDLREIALKRAAHLKAIAASISLRRAPL